MISVCIPTYEMNNAGSGLLKRSLDSLVNQTYKDFEVVISDNSENDSIEQMCGDPIYSSLRINYFKNPRKGMAQNTNEAIKQAKGEIIKILYQDDFLAHENSLKEIVDNFTGHWLVTGCEHENENGERYNPHLPTYSNKIKSGENSIGSPSVLSIKNGVAILFDENMTWMLDCDYYKRLYEEYGLPTILNDINVVIGTGRHQTTNILNEETKINEQKYMKNKHGKRLLGLFKLW